MNTSAAEQSLRDGHPAAALRLLQEQVRAMRAFLDGVEPDDFADPPRPG